MEIIYRVYEIVDVNEKEYQYDNKLMLDQTICCCNSREHFKEIVRDLYKPKQVHFANSKKLKEGDIYINIISENCYNTAQYFVLKDYKCDCCGKEFKSNEHTLIHFYSMYHLNKYCEQLYNERKAEIEGMVFCSRKCRSQKEKDLITEFDNYRKENNLLGDSYLCASEFDCYNDCTHGYIYMITKKSTNEFYVGQTKHVPMFRWVQHLRTSRFDIKNIQDYVYEILEVVSDISKLNEREAYWINKKRNENPKLSLNIQIPKEHQKTLFELADELMASSKERQESKKE